MNLATVPDYPEPEAEELTLRFTGGGSFILDTDPDPVPLWGSGQQVLWSAGEALTIVGGQGVGKTTLAQQLTLGRCGFDEHTDLLGLPVAPSEAQTVLYLAMDRPRQAARSFRRMVGEAWREQLDACLRVWQGPPLVDIARNPRTLREYAQAAGADTVIVDSIKDAAIGLSDDEVGGGWNRARQYALAAGIEMIELHHNRKAISGAKATSPSIDDVYGSTWVTSGSGSVVLLAGAPGDPVVKLHHLKQPAEEIGPWSLVHDHEAGLTSVVAQTDLLAIVAAAAGGVSALEAASVMFEVDKPSPAEREKARRKLDRLVRDGSIRLLDEGDRTAGRAARWGL